MLVAEDNLVNQRVLAAMLHRLGQAADMVNNGEEAITALAAKPYDVVLMDVEMPELDGLAATRIIRAPHSHVLDHMIRIVTMTAHALEGDRERCLAAGMDDYVAKPIQLNSLAATLQRSLLIGEIGA